MNESKQRGVPAETEQRLRRGEGDEVVVLEAGDPIDTAQTNPVEWDWDTDAIAGEHHCGSCGAWGPVFRLDDGSKICGACVHGQTRVP